MKISTRLKKGYSLIEILAALAIVSSVMIVSTSSIFSSARIAINNEIADRANTMAVRILELSKKVDKTIKDCGTGADLVIAPGKNYSVSNVDLTNANQAQNICVQEIVDNTLNTTCGDNSPYKTQIIRAVESKFERDETYCLQMRIDDLPDSTLDKVTIRLVFNDLSTDNITRTFYGII